MSKRPFEIAFDPTACFGADPSTLIVPREPVAPRVPVEKLAEPTEPTEPAESVTLSEPMEPAEPTEPMESAASALDAESVADAEVPPSRCATPDPLSMLSGDAAALATLLTESELQHPLCFNQTSVLLPPPFFNNSTTAEQPFRPNATNAPLSYGGSMPPDSGAGYEPFT